MAHPAFHLAVGMLAGTAALVPSVIRAIRQGRPTSFRFLLLLAGTCGAGFYAVVPNLCRGVFPETFCTGWWMNLFLFHPLLDQARSGGALIGQAGVLAVLGLQYALLLLAVRRARARRLRSAAPPPRS